MQNIHQVNLPAYVMNTENTGAVIFFLIALHRAKQVHVIKTILRIRSPKTQIFYNFCSFNFHFHMSIQQFSKLIYFLKLIQLSSTSNRLANVTAFSGVTDRTEGSFGCPQHHFSAEKAFPVAWQIFLSFALSQVLFLSQQCLFQ